MKHYEINGCKFAELTDVQEGFAIGMTFDKHIITKSDIDLIAMVLELEGLDLEELQMVRNAIVKLLCDTRSVYLDDEDFAKFDKLSTNMSAITCAIDSFIYRF